MKKYTLNNFEKEFPNDNACLDALFKSLHGDMLNCPKCGEAPNFKRISTRKCYQCQHTNCQYQIYPMKGTPFQKSTTGLKQWFYAFYLLTSSRNGVSAKQFERILSVSYPTALRMTHKIKELMGSGKATKLFGVVEMDEAYIGGLAKNMHYKKRMELIQGRGSVNKTPVFGMLEREGSIIVTVVDKTNAKTLMPIIKFSVHKKSLVITDGYPVYKNLYKDFNEHEVIDHHRGQYARGAFHTNSIESFWSHLKRMLRGTHIHVSRKHLQKYVDEAIFRYEHRHKPGEMFHALLAKITNK
jgi:transposase